MTPSEHVRRRVKLLQPLQRRVIELRYFRKTPLSFSEIAKVLREETGRRFRGTRAVSDIHYKALQTLRRMYGIDIEAIVLSG